MYSCVRPGRPRAATTTTTFMLFALMTTALFADERSEMPLALSEAIALALERDPSAARHVALADGLEAEATAQGQLPDPQIKLGLMNFPTDTFSRTQEPMTQIQVGLRQMFPRGDSLELEARKKLALANAERSSAVDKQNEAKLGVRVSWLDAFYWTRAARVVRESEGLFHQLVEITRAQYAAGRQNQQDVVRAQLELSRLRDRETRYLRESDSARARLGKWIGDEQSRRPLVDIMPELPEVPTRDAIRSKLPEHPTMQSAQARVEATKAGVDVSRQSYKPGWMLDFTYGFRDGNNADGSARADFASLMVVMDVPLFVDKRQDQTLAASQRREGAATSAKDDIERQLVQVLDDQYTNWVRLTERLDLFESTLLPQAQQYAIVSQSAYQNNQSDFASLMRARINELDTRLETLKLRVDRAKAESHLLYLAGEPL